MYYQNVSPRDEVRHRVTIRLASLDAEKPVHERTDAC
jgi:hypothetical protein